MAAVGLLPGKGVTVMRNLGTVALGAALAGCASTSADITPTYVSPVICQSYNCGVILDIQCKIILVAIH
jgi:hypothetical protein